jgi:hypothetical protein
MSRLPRRQLLHENARAHTSHEVLAALAHGTRTTREEWADAQRVIARSPEAAPTSRFTVSVGDSCEGNSSVSSEHPTGALVIRQRDDGQPFYEAKWRRGGRQVKRRVGPAWLDPAPAGGWQPRPGARPERLVRREARDRTDGRDGRRARRGRVRDRRAGTRTQAARRDASWQQSGSTTSSARRAPSRRRCSTTATCSRIPARDTEGAAGRVRVGSCRRSVTCGYAT